MFGSGWKAVLLWSTYYNRILTRYGALFDCFHRLRNFRIIYCICERVGKNRAPLQGVVFCDDKNFGEKDLVSMWSTVSPTSILYTYFCKRMLHILLISDRLETIEIPLFFLISPYRAVIGSRRHTIEWLVFRSSIGAEVDIKTLTAPLGHMRNVANFVQVSVRFFGAG